MSQSGMSAVRDLIREAASAGVRLWVADSRLHFKATRGELSDSLRERLRSRLVEVTAELSRPVVRRRSRTGNLLRLPDLWLDFWVELQNNLTMANSTHAVLRLSGDISPESIAGAFDTLCNRHDVLRARIQLQDGAPCVIFDQEPVAPVNIVDMSTGPGCEDSDRHKEIIERAIWDPLENGSVFRACVLRVSARDCFVAFVLHHFVSDLTSCQILARELVALLSGSRARGGLQPREPIQYFDYMSALVEWLAGPGPPYRLEYWLEQLRHAPQTRLPIDQDHAEEVGALDGVTFQIDGTFHEQIAKLAAAHGVTLAEVALAANFVALSEVTGCSDVLTVVVFSGREDPSLAHMVGSAVDCLPVRVLVSSQMSTSQLIQQVHESFSLAKHYRVPWSLLMRTLEEAGIRCAAPLFNFTRATHDGEQPPTFLDAGGLHLNRPPEQASVDWKTHQLDVFDTGHAAFGGLTYNSARHRRETAEALRAAFLESLARMVGRTAGESAACCATPQ